MTNLKYRLKKLRTAVLAVMGLSLVVIANSQSWIAGLPYHRNFSTSEYKGGLQNFEMMQDRRGILYVANNYGLLEYDGTQWQTFGEMMPFIMVRL